jgi:hypothetical protein
MSLSSLESLFVSLLALRRRLQVRMQVAELGAKSEHL